MQGFVGEFRGEFQGSGQTPDRHSANTAGWFGKENIVQKRFPPGPATSLPSCCGCHVYSLDWAFDLAKAYSYENPAACNFVFIQQFGLG